MAEGTGDGSGRGINLGLGFDWKLNFGHLLILATMVSCIFLAWQNLKSQADEVSIRTADYSVIRDLTRSNTTRIEALNTIVTSVSATNSTTAESIAKIREDVASIKATLNERRQ